MAYNRDPISKELRAAIRVWRNKKCPCECCVDLRRTPDYTKAPKALPKVWTAKDFDRYQQRTRFAPLSDTVTRQTIESNRGHSRTVRRNGTASWEALG